MEHYNTLMTAIGSTVLLAYITETESEITENKIKQEQPLIPDCTVDGPILA